MLGLTDNSALEQLRAMSVYFDGDFIEGLDEAKFSLENSNGKGYIASYSIFKGLSVRTYNIKFTKDFKISLKFSKKQPYYFCYLVNGYMYHKLDGEENHSKIEKNQSFIITSKSGSTADVVFPAGTLIQMSIIIIDKEELDQIDSKNSSKLQKDLKQLEIDTEKPKAFRYTGKILPSLSQFAEIIINNERTDLVGRLLVEGAAKNILAKQLENYNQIEEEIEISGVTLTKSELSKISNIGDYLSDRISQKLTVTEFSREVGLSPKKLQKGMKMLYGDTFSNYVLNYRLEYAKNLIQTTELNISEVCYEISINSRSYFSKSFKERFGFTPIEYKKSFEDKNALFELSYRSNAVENISKEDIQEILATSKQANAKHNVSGSLIYYNNMFFQIIEGSKKNILQLIENINNDPRHYDVEELWKGPIVKRNFEKWSMVLISENENEKSFGNIDIAKLKIDQLVGEIKNPSITSNKFWNRVRNALIVNNKE